MSFLSKATREIFSNVYKEIKNEKNKKQIYAIVDFFFEMFLQQVRPYFYAIVCILLVMFAMNCVQFYYYLKIVIKHNKIDILTMQSVA
jgi:hypothetical protein